LKNNLKREVIDKKKNEFILEFTITSNDERLISENFKEEERQIKSKVNFEIKKLLYLNTKFDF